MRSFNKIQDDLNEGHLYYKALMDKRQADAAGFIRRHMPGIFERAQKPIPERWGHDLMDILKRPNSKRILGLPSNIKTNITGTRFGEECITYWGRRKIYYYKKSELFYQLEQEHVDLILRDSQKKIAQSFLDFRDAFRIQHGKFLNQNGKTVQLSQVELSCYNISLFNSINIHKNVQKKKITYKLIADDADHKKKLSSVGIISHIQNQPDDLASNVNILELIFDGAFKLTIYSGMPQQPATVRLTQTIRPNSKFIPFPVDALEKNKNFIKYLEQYDEFYRTANKTYEFIHSKFAANYIINGIF